MERIEEAVRQERLSPRAVASFSCSGRGMLENVELPRPVRDRHVVDATAWVRPLLAVLDEYHRCRVVVVDRARARFFDLYLGEVVECPDRLQDPTLRTPDYAAGMRERTVHNKAELLAKRHYRAVAERLDEEARRHEFDIVAVGGHDHEIPEFLDHLPAAVRERVAGTFSVHLREDALGMIRRRAEQVVERDRELRRTPDVVDELVQAVIDEGGSVEHVAAETPVREHVAAATLRFPLPHPVV